MQVAVIEHNVDPSSTKEEKVSESWNPKPIFCSNEGEICQCEKTGAIFKGSSIGDSNEFDDALPYQTKQA